MLRPIYNHYLSLLICISQLFGSIFNRNPFCILGDKMCQNTEKQVQAPVFYTDFTHLCF